MVNPRMLRDRHDCAADQNEIETTRKSGCVAKKEIEELLAALVLVDAADIDGKRPSQVVLPAKSFRIRSRRDVRTDADDHTRNLFVACGGLDHRPLFVRVVHHRAYATKGRAKDAKADRWIAFCSRHQQRLGGDSPRAMPRMEVAIAEEQDEIERRRGALEIVDHRRTR